MVKVEVTAKVYDHDVLVAVAKGQTASIQTEESELEMRQVITVSTRKPIIHDTNSEVEPDGKDRQSD